MAGAFLWHVILKFLTIKKIESENVGGKWKNENGNVKKNMHVYCLICYILKERKKFAMDKP
jgi:hypothetical protein